MRILEKVYKSIKIGMISSKGARESSLAPFLYIEYMQSTDAVVYRKQKNNLFH